MSTLNIGITPGGVKITRFSEMGGVKITRVSEILSNAISETHASQHKYSAKDTIKSIYSQIIGTRISTHLLGKRVRVVVQNTTFRKAMSMHM